MKTDSTPKLLDFEAIRKQIADKWSDQGGCRSCGWHDGLSDYTIDDEDIVEALENRGELHLCCMSDDEDSDRHRGVSVYVTAVYIED